MAVAELRPHYVCVACATIMAYVPPYIYIYIPHQLEFVVSLASLARQLKYYSLLTFYQLLTFTVAMA